MNANKNPVGNPLLTEIRIGRHDEAPQRPPATPYERFENLASKIIRAPGAPVKKVSSAR
jgi:hypothetical protein